MMPCPPPLSVLCPVYNAMAFLPETVASLRAQTFKTWEAIFVDDGSRDASQAFLAEAAREDGRIRIVAQRNAGICGGRNRALDVMRGEAFVHMDQDDLLAPYALEALEAGARESGATLVVGRMLQFEDDPPQNKWVPGGHFVEGEAWRQLVADSIYRPAVTDLCFPSWNKRYDRATFGAYRFLPVRYGDDTYYTPLTHLATPRAYILNAVTYYWRVGHVSGHTGTCTPAWIHGYASALAEGLKLTHGEKRFQRAFRSTFKWIASTCLIHYILTGRVQKEPEAADAICRFATIVPPVLRLPWRWRVRCFLMRHRCWRLTRLMCQKLAPSSTKE